jgi:hypothetical protein
MDKNGAIIAKLVPAAALMRKTIEVIASRNRKSPRGVTAMIHPHRIAHLVYPIRIMIKPAITAAAWKTFDLRQESHACHRRAESSYPFLEETEAIEHRL